jgi:hypothetical protein
MNNQFDKLVYESGLVAQGCWDKFDEYDKQALNKFAELIVRECAELTSRYQMGTTRLPDIIVSYNYSDKLEDVLKKHFGVEE